MKPRETKFGAAIRAARETKGSKQTELAAALGVHQSAISAWENGKAFPTAFLLVGLAEMLEVDIAELVRLIAAEQAPEPEPVG